MATLEKIRAEIADNHDFYFFAESNKDIALGLEYALEILDKYAEKEPTDEWQNGYDMAWEEAEVFYEQEPCDDVVSRQAVIEIIDEEWLCNAEYEFRPLVEAIEKLPPVRPQEQTGHWIRQDNTKEPLYGWYFCSECNSVIGDKTKFCSNCGCRMVEPQESEKQPLSEEMFEHYRKLAEHYDKRNV